METLLLMDLVHWKTNWDVYLVVGINRERHTVNLFPLTKTGMLANDVPISAVWKLTTEELLASQRVV